VECRVCQSAAAAYLDFGGNPLACAAALAALDVLVDDDLAANARERGAELLEGARAIARRYRMPSRTSVV